MMRPDHSPAMLQLFLRARAAHVGHMAGPRAAEAEKRRIRRKAGVTVTEFEMAWMGRVAPVGAGSRACEKLWRALGHEPMEAGHG